MIINVDFYLRIYLNDEPTNYVINTHGIIINEKTGRILVHHSDKDGYYIVNLSHRSIHYTKKVHRLVASLFVPNPDNKPEVHHKDGNHRNNHFSNLHWCTKEEHWELERAKGKFNRAKGEKQGSAKYSDDVMKKAIHDLSIGVERTIVSKRYSIDLSTLYRVYHKKGWTHLTEDVAFPELPKQEREEYSEQLKENILELLNEGLSPKSIAENLGLEYTKKLVNYIKTMRRRKIKNK